MFHSKFPLLVTVIELLLIAVGFPLVYYALPFCVENYHLLNELESRACSLVVLVVMLVGSQFVFPGPSKKSREL